MTAEAVARDLRERYPGWHIWRGPAGLWYARRLLTSPPVVLKDRTIEGLGSQLAAQSLNAAAPGGDGRQPGT